MAQKTKILIVEDEKDLSTSIRNQLAAGDYEVSVADDGEKAISFIEEKEFAIAVLDLKLPKIGGIEVLKFIKKNFPKMKVIITTGYADLKNNKVCKDLGADLFIDKPYELGDLFDAIKLVVAE